MFSYIQEGCAQKDYSERVLRLGAGVRSANEQVSSGWQHPSALLHNPAYIQAAQRFVATLATEADHTRTRHSRAKT